VIVLVLGGLMAARCGSIIETADGGVDAGVDGGDDATATDDGGLDAQPDNWTACGVLPDAPHEYWDCCDGSLCRGGCLPEGGCWCSGYQSFTGCPPPSVCCYGAYCRSEAECVGP
jgi:hypothetical protein